MFWRILFFYVISLLLIGFIVPYNDPNLLNGGSDATASPFVIAINMVKQLDSRAGGREAGREGGNKVGEKDRGRKGNI